MLFRQRSNSNHCERTERTAEDMKRHVQRVHEGIKYPCDQCCYVSKTKGYLGFHVKSQHNTELLSCSEEYCSYETYNKNTLKSHFDTEHGIVKYKCEIMNCNCLSAWKRSLRAHNLTRGRVHMMQTEIWIHKCTWGAPEVKTPQRQFAEARTGKWENDNLISWCHGI